MASVHPSLRNILDVPETAPPRPRPGLRTTPNHGPTRVRRIPGPPPPKSWLYRSAHAPKQLLDANHGRRQQYQTIKLPEAYLVEDRSLQHVLLRTLALNWNWHAEYDHEYLTELPLKLRETLLSYIAILRAGEAQLSNPLSVLFPAPGGLQRDPSKDETHEVQRLDLTNSLGRWLSLKGLRKALLSTERESVQAMLTTPSESIPSPVFHGVFQKVPDSWEDDSEQELGQIWREPAINPTSNPLQTPRFPGLRHLSLALDPTVHSSAASWSGLLSIAAHLRTLESLSLAYWPLPTYTPEAAATYATVGNHITKSRQRFVYDGTNMYSALDNDWRESSGILKSLSRSLYCLRWLDLTGCVSWLPALAWEDTSSPAPIDDDFYTAAPNSDSPGEHGSASIWNGHWRGVTWLGIGVGWRPVIDTDGTAVNKLSAEYNALRQSVEDVARQIRLKRQAGKGQSITFELGQELMNGSCSMPPGILDP